ncbi:hypothetical protein J7J26_00780 [Candidatus Micrarchaeota archaeon]|nr:hypothetical protein [Candidatus Micrarchaeota archaeon]
MFKNLFVIALLFGLVAVTFAGDESVITDQYNQEFSIDNFNVVKGLTVVGERVLDIVRHVATYKYYTVVNISVTNDNIPKRWVELTDCYIGPEGLKINNITQSIDGDVDVKDNCITWRIEDIDPNDKMTFSYLIKTDMRNISKPEIDYKNKRLELIIPETAHSTEEIIITVIDEDNSAVPLVNIKVSGPESSEANIKTDNEGKAKFKFDKAGEYLFSIDGKEYSVNVEPLREQASTNAMVVEDNDNNIKPSDFMPLFVALIALAVVLIGLLVYYSSKSSDTSHDGSDEFFGQKKIEFPPDNEYSDNKFLADEDSHDELNSESKPDVDVDQRMEEIKELTKRIIENRKKARELGYVVSRTHEQPDRVKKQPGQTQGLIIQESNKDTTSAKDKSRKKVSKKVSKTTTRTKKKTTTRTNKKRRKIIKGSRYKSKAAKKRRKRR